jgi:signal transduction histidine kinase
MTPLDRIVFLVSADGELIRQVIGELARFGKHYQLPIAISQDQARARLGSITPAIILLDESAAEGESLEEIVQEFACFAPVVLLAAPERQQEVAELVALGQAEFVARAGTFLPMAVALLERRMRCAERADAEREGPASERPADFLEILRHEVNNPLTGILGNAELLLARRDRLPAAVAQRLETIADLSVRLRETLRRLTWSWEARQDQVRSA